MGPKTGGNGNPPKKRIHSLDDSRRRSVIVEAAAPGPSNSRKQLVGKTNQSNFSIAPLILEGVKLAKLELNDLLKAHLPEAKLSDIQLNRAGTFTLFSVDVPSFNKVLNDLATILKNKGHPNAKTFVPRSIQRIKDTERVAFVKRVDLEIPDARIKQALKDVGLQTSNVDRLRSKDGNTPTRTVKITFDDAANRNTFVRTGLQIDSMHFGAEAATQNSKPVQCYLCLKYNHVAKYCKTKQQTCLRCGEDHRADQCKVNDENVKCCNCKGKHLATSTQCSFYQEQEKRAKKLINQYANPNNNKTTTPPPLHSTTDFPPLPNALRPDLFNEIINVLSAKMEKLIEETTQRIVNTLQKKITKLEKALGQSQDKEDELTMSEADSSFEECQVQKYIENKKQQKEGATKEAPTTTKTTTTTANTTTTTTNTNKKKKKRPRSPNSSMEISATTNKDLKTSNKDA